MGGKSRGSNGQMMSQDEAVAAANQNIAHGFFGQPSATEATPAAARDAAADAPTAASGASTTAKSPAADTEVATPDSPGGTGGSDGMQVVQDPGSSQTPATAQTHGSTGEMLAQTITSPSAGPSMWQDQLRNPKPPDDGSMTMTGQV